MIRRSYDPYASHLPPLSFVLRKLRRSIRSILEVGTGFYSTPLFQAFSSGSEGRVEHVILESDEEWTDHVVNLFDVRIYPFDVHELPDVVVRRYWSLAFIDCLVEATRAKHATRLKDKTDVIVLHDSNPDWDTAYGYSAIIPHWKYAHHFTATYPHTLVLTDSDDVWSALGIQPT